MRIAFFHNWSWLGSAVARSLIEAAQDELWILGAPTPRAERDPDLVDLAKRSGVLAVAPRDVSDPRFISRLSKFAPDLILVATFPKKMPPALIAVPKIAAINVHASLLPKYRGALPEFWVLRNGEPESGLSVHLMTERFDAGRVLAQARFPLSPDETLLTLSIRLGQIGPDLVRGLLDKYRAGERPEGWVQDESIATRAPNPKPEDLRVQWTESAEAIMRLLRAAYPVFEAHTQAGDQRVIVRRVRPAQANERPKNRLRPGVTWVDAKKRAVVVGTGDVPVVLEGVELATNVLPGFALVERKKLKSGDVLG